jgi:hypothetical protein
LSSFLNPLKNEPPRDKRLSFTIARAWNKPALSETLPFAAA